MRTDSPTPELVVDIAANRASRKYSVGEQFRRVAWAAGQWLLRLSPRPLFGWRRFVLRSFGARVGEQAHVYPGTRIFMPWNLELGAWCAIGDGAFIYNLGRVVVGAHATISYRAHICAGTHDFSRADLPLLKPPVHIGERAWIGTEAFIGPGVSIEPGAIVGARAVVIKDVAALDIVAGNPARRIGTRAAPRP